LTPGATTPVLASHKATTTADVTLGIQNAVAATLEKAKVDKSRIQAIAIGTTSFVNSLIERNAEKLERVAVVRLCGPYSRLSPPFAGFPYELRAVLEGPAFLVEGGIQVDGKEISQVSRFSLTHYVEGKTDNRSTRTRLEVYVAKLTDKGSRRLLYRPSMHLSILPPSMKRLSGRSSNKSAQMSRSRSARK
jgi:hypothetical protein